MAMQVVPDVWNVLYLDLHVKPDFLLVFGESKDEAESVFAEWWSNSQTSVMRILSITEVWAVSREDAPRASADGSGESE